MSDIRILNLKMVEKGSIIASFSLSYGPLTVNEFRLMRGESGDTYARPPQREYIKRDGGRGWVNVAEMTPTELKVLTKRVLAMLSRPAGGNYQGGPSGGQSPPQQPQGQYPPRQPHSQGYDDNYSPYQGEADEIPF